VKSLDLIIKGTKFYRETYVSTMSNAINDGVPLPYTQVCWQLHKAMFDADRSTPANPLKSWNITTTYGGLRYLAHMIRESLHCSERTRKDVEGYGNDGYRSDL